MIVKFTSQKEKKDSVNLYASDKNNRVLIQAINIPNGVEISLFASADGDMPFLPMGDGSGQQMVLTQDEPQRFVATNYYIQAQVPDGTVLPNNFKLIAGGR